jgi:glyoxylase-like metal-dependent hydrolase (beta-lactamase superfamily II)
LRDGQRIRVGSGSWTVAWLPGHSPEHLGLVHASSGTAITGDLLLRGAGTIPFLQGRDATGHRPSTLADLIASWRRLGRMRLSILWPGHGGPVRAHRVLIARRLALLRSRLADTRRALEDGASSIWEVSCSLGPEPPSPERLQSSLGETVALLDWLVERQRATRRLVDDRLVYAALPRRKG